MLLTTLVLAGCASSPAAPEGSSTPTVPACVVDAATVVPDPGTALLGVNLDWGTEQLAEFSALGATLVALSPQRAALSADMVAKHGLGFDILSDPGNAYAAHLGLRFVLPVWASPGALCVTHAELPGGHFIFKLELVHPRFGALIRQSVVFWEAQS